jgi:hypothetical protein
MVDSRRGAYVGQNCPISLSKDRSIYEGQLVSTFIHSYIYPFSTPNMMKLLCGVDSR